tara:strand:- start:6542 stop:6883 length:342 start_codon:yes stop_codon:yes gene_type:complete
MIQLKNHFKAWAPKEACGVFTDTFNFIECKNISLDNDLFCFCPEEYFNILRKYKVAAIVHSHINASNTASESDIDTCNVMNLPYYIYSYPSMELNILLPALKIGVQNEKKSNI